MNFRNWFFTFCTEKGWYASEDTFLLNDLELTESERGNYINLDFKFFIEFLMSDESNHSYIKKGFIYLDFNNANCRDFLHHLINGMLVSYNMDEVYKVKHSTL